MQTTCTPNGHAAYNDQDWAASLDCANDQQRHVWPRDQRTPCHNADCEQLSEALFCSEACREQAEGPDRDDACEPEEEITAAENSKTDRGNVDVVATLKSHPLPEAPVSMNVHLPMGGRDVLVTLRGTDLQAVLSQMETLLHRYPVETKTNADHGSTVSPAQASTPPAPSQMLVCQWHGAMKQSTKAPGTWYCPAKMGDGSFCKERSPAKGR